MKCQYDKNIKYTMRKSILFIVIFIIPIISFGQDEFYQTYNNRDYNFLRVSEIVPSVAEFQVMKHFNFPKCNGKIDVTLPLYTIKYKNLEVPIYLSYNTAGIKVNGVASRVGQNWHLTAGGQITRTQKGSMLDFTTYWNGMHSPGFVENYYGWQVHEPEEQTVGIISDYSENAAVYDLEPDVFFLTAPGLTSQFIINRDEEAVEIKGDDIKIKNISFAEGDISSIQVLSNQGVYYNFSKVSKCQVNLDIRIIYPPQDWYLTSMILPSGEKIIFEYDDGGYEVKVNQGWFYVRGAKSEMSSTQIPEYTSGTERKLQLTASTRLTKISFGSGTVEFKYEHEREDISSDNALSSIEIVNSEDEPVKTINFDYNYLYNSEGSASRLMLDQIIFKGDDSETYETYGLEYYPGVFPKYTSKQYDYFGYYANHAQTTNTTKVYAYIPTDVTKTVYYPFYVSNTGYDVTSFNGEDRTPVEDDNKIGMLKYIYYPTGGVLELAYELNQFSVLGKNVKGAGLRVKKQSLIDAKNTWYKTYVYEFPSIKFPRFAMLGTSELHLADNTTTGRRTFVRDYTVRYDENQVNFDLFDGSPVIYEKVSEIQQNNGKILYYFNTQDDLEASTSFDGDGYYQNYLNFNKSSGWPFWSGRSFSSMRGAVEEKLIFDNSGKMIKGEIYEYSFNLYDIENVDIVKGLYYKEWKTPSWKFAKVSGSYDIVPGKRILDRKHTITIPDNIAVSPTRLLDQINSSSTLKNNLLIETETFEYNSDYLQLKTHEVIPSNGETRGLINYYAIDYGKYGTGPHNTENSDEANKALYEMIHNKYMFGVPIETMVYKKDADVYILGGTINEFKKVLNTDISYNTIFKAKEYNLAFNNPYWVQEHGMFSHIDYDSGNDSYTLEKNSNYELLKEFEYSEHGNLINANYANDYPVSYVWGYNNAYLIAKVVNANNSEVIHESFEISGFNSERVVDGISKTGKKSSKICYVDWSNKTTIDLIGGKEYIVSYWTKKGTSSDYSRVAIGGVVSVTITPPASGEWVYKEQKVLVPVDNGGVKNVYLLVKGGSDPRNTSIYNYLDDLRIYPADAQMSTYTYDPLVGMTSQTNAQGVTTHYKYEDNGRLSVIKDNDNKVLSKYDYNKKPGSSGSTGSTGSSYSIVSERVYKISYNTGEWCYDGWEDFSNRCNGSIYDFSEGNIALEYKITNTQTGQVHISDYSHAVIVPQDNLNEIIEKIANELAHDLGQVHNISGFNNLTCVAESNTIILKQLDESINTDMSIYTFDLTSVDEYPDPSLCKNNIYNNCINVIPPYGNESWFEDITKIVFE
ncbi:hypothetical protein ACFLS4_00175 [Bacteroidota bacterium]